MGQQSKKYILGLDIIRIIAMVLVVTVHSTTFNNWSGIQHEITIINFVASFTRYLSFACVPLFIVLTGFLNKDKTISWNFYKKIIRVLIEFALSSILVGVFRILYLGEEFSAFSFLKGLIIFSLAPYAWYINMYIGLFLIIPFLNLLYNNLPSKKIKLLFLGALIVVLSLPGTTSFCTWNYWITAYPIMYYYIGCYLKEFDLSFKKPYIVFVLLFTILCSTIISIFNVPFMHVQNHNNIFCVITTVLIFKLIQNIEIKKNNTATRIIRTISNNSLSYFLLSYIFDKLFEHEIFIAKGLSTFYEKFVHLIYIVPCTIVLSISVAIFVGYVTNLLTKLFDMIIKDKISI